MQIEYQINISPSESIRVTGPADDLREMLQKMAMALSIVENEGQEDLARIKAILQETLLKKNPYYKVVHPEQAEARTAFIRVPITPAEAKALPQEASKKGMKPEEYYRKKLLGDKA